MGVDLGIKVPAVAVTSTGKTKFLELRSWSFYRLSQYIEYKAKLAGIVVEYVNPYNTSKICPNCGQLNEANDRDYQCSSCGFRIHRDRVGAINIMNAPRIDAKGLSA